MPLFSKDPDAAADRAQQRELQRWRTPTDAPSPGAGVLFFPHQPITAGSSRLRARQVAPHLRELGWRAAVVPASASLDQRRARIADFKPDLLVLLRTLHKHNDPKLYPDHR
ncbi:MAG: hypothetical protein AAF612_09090, partial [Planctomycetota bacterium]